MSPRTLTGLLFAAAMVPVVGKITSASVPTSVVWSPGTYMRQAIDTVLERGYGLTVGTDLGFDGTHSVSGVFLQKGEAYTLGRYLESDREYVFIASGDTDAKDVDLEILDAAENRVAGDTLTARDATVRYRPASSGQYRIRVRLYDAERPAYCAFAVLREQGWTIPQGNLDAASDQFFERGEEVARVMGTLGADTDFVGQGNAAVHGVLLERGQSITLDSLYLGSDPVMAFAAGDTQVRDIDLHLLDVDGNVVASDTEPDAAPIVVNASGPEGRYSLRVTNASSNGKATFVLFGLVDAH